MKKIITGTALMMSLCAQAESVGVCPSIGLLAEQVMMSRHAGVPLDSVIGVMEKSDDSIREISKRMAIAAYSEPAYQSEIAKRKSITEFRNGMVLLCYSERTK